MSSAQGRKKKRHRVARFIAAPCPPHPISPPTQLLASAPAPRACDPMPGPEVPEEFIRSIKEHTPAVYDIVGRGRMPAILFRQNTVQLVYGAG
jgi:hypothetical protein